MTGSQTGGDPPADDQGGSSREAGRGRPTTGRSTGGRRRDPDGDPDAGPAPSPVPNPMLAMLSAMQSMSEAALAPLTGAMSAPGMAQLGPVGEAQWQAMRETMSTLSQLPLTSLDQAVKEVLRLREAIGVMQLQLEAFDQQLTALQAVIRPLQQWAHLWRPPV